MSASADYPGGRQGDEFTVELTLLGRPFLGLNGGPNCKSNEEVGFVVHTEAHEVTHRMGEG